MNEIKIDVEEEKKVSLLKRTYKVVSYKKCQLLNISMVFIIYFSILGYTYKWIYNCKSQPWSQVGYFLLGINVYFIFIPSYNKKVVKLYLIKFCNNSFLTLLSLCDLFTDYSFITIASFNTHSTDFMLAGMLSIPYVILCSS